MVLDQDTKGQTVQECFYRLPDTVKATETTFGMDPDFKVVKSDVGEAQIEFLGATLSDVSPLRELRRACKQLGIPQSGSKSVCFQRLRHHLEEGHRKVAVELAHEAFKDEVREPTQPPLPVAPSLQEQLTHEITHIPFAPWCECCVATRSREDPGSTRTMTRTNVAPTFALDYMFTNTPGDDGEGPDSKMNVHLVGYDSWSKQVMCLPVAKKGGNSLKVAVKEVLRHTSSYAEVIFKADS